MSAEHKLVCLNAIDLVKWWGCRENQPYFPADPGEWPAIIRAYIRERAGADVNDEQAVSSLMQELHKHANYYVEWVKLNHTIH